MPTPLSSFRSPIALQGARWLVGGVLIVAGILKAYTLDAFAANLLQYGIPTEALGLWLTRALILAELVIGGTLIAGYKTRAAAGAAAAMMFGFTVFAAYHVAIGEPISCQCFGGVAWLEGSAPRHLIQNTVLFGLAAWVFTRAPEDSWPPSRQYGLALAVGCALVFAIRTGDARVPAETTALAPSDATLPVQAELTTRAASPALSLGDAIASDGLTAVVVFRTTDCAMCFDALPSLGARVASLPEPPSGQRLVGVALDTDLNELEGFTALRDGWNLPVAAAAPGESERFAVPGLETPYLLLVAPDGSVQSQADLPRRATHQRRMYAAAAAQLAS